MYQNAFYDGKEVHIWDDEKGHIKVPFSRYAYKLDENGHCNTYDGKKASKVTKWSKKDEEKGLIYENGFGPETRVLADMYYESDDVSKNHRILYWDIETEKTEEGYSEPWEAKNRITSVAFYFDGIYTLILGDYNDVINFEGKKTEHGALIQKNIILEGAKELIGEEIKADIIVIKDEQALIYRLIEYWRSVNPTINIGWNSEKYDIPYTINRIINVFGREYAEFLSPINTLTERPQRDHPYLMRHKIAGVSSLDLMLLYKQFTQNEKDSYSLDNISHSELGEGKIEYDGDLNTLFNEDLAKFCVYNIQDVRLLVKLENKKRFVGLSMNIAHKGHVTYENVYFPSVCIDGAALVFLKRNGLVAAGRKPYEDFTLLRNHYKGEKVLEFKKNFTDHMLPDGDVWIFKSKSSKFFIRFTRYEDNKLFLAEPLSQHVFSDYEVKPRLPGAFVKDPQRGLHKWLFDVDLQSLYPSIMMTLNISPETKIGKICNWVWDGLQNPEHLPEELIFHVPGEGYTNVKRDKLITYIKTKQVSISANGVIYDCSKRGFIPIILEAWFNERADLKKLMKKYASVGNEELRSLYYLRQWTQKVLLNTFYGVLALPSFRYRDVSNASAVTSTGQSIIKNTEVYVNEKYYELMGQELPVTEKIEITDEEDNILLFDVDEKLMIKRNGAKKLIRADELEEEDEILSD